MEKVADFFYHSRSCRVEGETQNSMIGKTPHIVMEQNTEQPRP